MSTNGGRRTEARNERKLMSDVLQERWIEDIGELEQFESDDRPNNVPEPVIRLAGNEADGVRAQNYASDDVIYVSDGGDPTLDPASVGFRDVHVEQVIDVIIRTSKGPIRFFGEDEEVYGGLVGEVQRIVDSARFGIGPYDYVFYDTFSDETEDYGADTWHGQWPIRFIAYSDPILQTGER